MKLKLFLFSATLLALVASTTEAIKISLFTNTATYADRSKDIIIATCDGVESDVNFGDGLHPVAITVFRSLKGKITEGPTKIATIYPMEAGKTYLLMSLGGLVDDIRFLAVPQLSVIELPAHFDLTKLQNHPLTEQLQIIFRARKTEVEQKQLELNEESELLAKALQKAG